MTSAAVIEELISKRLEQLAQRFAGKPNTVETRRQIKECVADELNTIERLIGYPPPWANVPRVRRVIEMRIEGHNN